MEELLAQIKNCKLCDKNLELGANPVMSAGINSKIIIIGQAPGSIVHKTGIPWNDKSGDTLRTWMGIDKEIFYNTEKISLVPMGFCYPGAGKTGDLPPRTECAPLWHNSLLEKMPNVKLILLIGQYSQNYYLGEQAAETVTATVQHFKVYLPKYFPLPHPSPRNNIWQSRNFWFEAEVLPKLRGLVKRLV